MQVAGTPTRFQWTTMGFVGQVLCQVWTTMQAAGAPNPMYVDDDGVCGNLYYEPRTGNVCPWKLGGDIIPEANSSSWCFIL